MEEPAGKNVIGYREWLTLRELVVVFTQATGLAAEAIQLPEGKSKVESPPDLKLELDDNFAYWNECGYEGRDDPTIIHPRDVSGSMPISLSINADIGILAGISPKA